MKKYYTTSKSGEWVFVDQALAKSLVASGKKKPEDFEIVEDNEGSQSPVWGGVAGYDKSTPMPTGEMQPEAGGTAKVKPGIFSGVQENIQKLGKTAMAPVRAALAGVETVPDIASNINVSRYAPFIGVDENAGENISKAFSDSYNKTDPNIVETMITDPVNLFPAVRGIKALQGAGKFAKYLIEPAINAGIQTGGEAVMTGDVLPEMIASNMAVGTGAGALLSKIAPSIGGAIKEGAVVSLGQDVKLKPSDQLKKFSPELEVLFKNKDIPLKGGTRAIVENVTRKLDDLKRTRGEYLAKKESETIEQASKTGSNDLIGTVDLENVRMDALNKIEDLDRKSGLELADKNELIAIVNAKIDDVYRRSPLSEFIDEGQIPLSQAAKRRTLWGEQGDINNPKTSSKTPNEKEVARMLWSGASKELHNDPTFSKSSKQMAEYVPLDNALQGRLPAIENRYGATRGLLGISTIPNRIWSSNPAIVGRYALGKMAEQKGQNASRYAIPAYSSLVSEKKK